MLENSFEKFRELVLCDATLQETLRVPTRDDAFIEMVVRLGAERGFGFTADEVRDAMRANRRAWLERWI
jgi:Nif11 domain